MAFYLVLVKTELYKNYLAGKIDFNLYKCYQNKLTLLVRSAKALYYKNYTNLHRKNSKAMCKLIDIANQLLPKLSCSYDNVSVKIVKLVINSISKPLTNILNESF